MKVSNKHAVDLRIIMCCAIVAITFLTMFLSLDAEAQPRLPDVLPDGVDANENDPANLLIQIVKFIVGVVLWVGVLWLGVRVIWEAIGDVRDAKNGDTKWIAAGKSIAGGVFMFLAVLAVALWLTNQFLT